MVYNKNAEWKTGSTGGTPITAAKLNNLETQYEQALVEATKLLPIRLWNKTSRTWPAINGATGPVIFMSTNDKTADIPAEARVEFDVWIPHVDATNA
jgi:hypothetical protein